MHNYDERTDKIGEMLESEDKQMSSIPPRMENVLSRLFRRILMMERMNTKALAKTDFTWNNFTQAIRFLQTKKLRIIIERTDFQGRVTTVEETVEFNKPPVYSEEDENKETQEAEEAKYRGIE